MSRYEFFKTAHVLMAVIWVGGASTLQLLAFRAIKASEPGRMAAFGKDAEWVGTRIFTPASLLVLGFGIAMVLDADAIGFGDEWVLFGLVGIAFSAVVGATFLGPESGRIAKVIETKGPTDPEVDQRIKRILVISRIELAILLLIVINMVIKPGA